MSVYGWFCCTDCAICLWLGKAISASPGSECRLDHFHVGTADEPPNWARENLNRAIWKMLADHEGHNLKVLLDDGFEKLAEKSTVREIGGHEMGDISIEEYIAEKLLPDR